MGDMNDDPMDKSMAIALGAKRKTQDTKEHDLYNPWWDTLKKGNGTLMYDGKWNLFDQIVFTGNLLGNDRSTLGNITETKFSEEIICSKKKESTKDIPKEHMPEVYGLTDIATTCQPLFI